jgi:hypothetical protein
MVFLVVGCMAVSASAEVSAWFAPSASKVMRDAQPNAEAKSWDLASAKNEVEACQLVLLADKPTEGVVVSASEFRLADGSAALVPQLLKVEYVPNIVKETPYPDPLPPLTPLNLQPNQAQPVWISVKAPKDAKPGDYSATVTVKAGEQKIELPVRLHVWNFALPDTPSSATAFGLGEDQIAKHSGVAANSPESKKLYAAYYEMLLDHRISAYSIPVDLMSDEAAKYMNDPRMTAFQIPYPPEDEKLKALVEHLKKNNWYSKGFFYPIDEPKDKPAYEEISRISDRLHQCAPGYQWVVPFFCRPNWDRRLSALDLMTNRVNLWCPNSNYLEVDPKSREALAIRHRLGEKIWWYVCCGPGEPFNNLFVQMNAMSHRILFWQQKRENVEGLLYWAATWWPVEDPWTDMATLKDINAELRGDGSVFYPGKKVGVDGPVSSLRLELIRDGLEDFDYLTLADTWLGKEKSNEFVEKLAPDLKHYEKDPLVLEKVRRELGDLLEKSKPADQ